MSKYCKNCLIKNKYIEDKLSEIEFLIRNNYLLGSQVCLLSSILKKYISNNNIKVVAKK